MTNLVIFWSVRLFFLLSELLFIMVAKIVVILEYFHMEVLLGVGKTGAPNRNIRYGGLVEGGGEGGGVFSFLVYKALTYIIVNYLSNHLHQKRYAYITMNQWK